MAREFFKDLPNTTTPLTASRLNGLLNGDEALGSIVVDDVNGKNIFGQESVSWYRNNSSSFSDTTNTSTTRIRTSSFAIEGGKTYTVSGIPSGISLLVVSEYDTYGGTRTTYASTTTFTLGDSIKYISLIFGGSDFTDATNTLMANANIQIELGSTATNYAKGKKIIKEQNGYVKESCTFYADDFKCKNLFTSSMQLGSLDNNTGAKASSTDAIRTEYFIEVEPDTTYTISNDKQYHIYTYEYNSSYTFIKYTGANTDAYKSKSTITTTSTTKYIKIRTVVSNVENDLTSKWQLEVGSEATSYTPYKKFENDLGNQFKFVTQINGGNSLTYSFTDDDAINKCYLIVISKGPLDGTFGGMWFIRRGATASAKICQTGSDNVTMSVSISGNTITCSFSQWANYCRMNVYQIMVAS